MAYCYQNGHPLGFAVQLRLTPELKQALISARASGEPFSLRFRDEPHREAVLTVAGQEYFFSTAQQAGQVEVVEMDPGSKSASSVASVKQRLTIQRPLEGDTRPRALGFAGTLAEDRRKRSAVLLDGNQRGGGVHPRVTTTTEIVTRPAPPPQCSLGGGAPGLSGRLGNGMAALGPGGSSFRPNQGSASAGPRAGGGSTRPVEVPKPMELPKPRSQQPGGCALVKPPPTKARITPTPPRQDSGGSGDGTAAGQLDIRPGSGGSGGGGGSSPVGYGSGGAPGNGSGGGAAAAATTTAPPPPVELPRGAVMAARRGDLPLVVAALLREQPLTASSLQSRIDQAYRTAAAKLEAREYVKRVIDNCCTMSANRMHLRPDVLAREGPRLDELLSGTSPTTDAAVERGRGNGAGRNGSTIVQGATAKRMASCSPDRRTSPDTHQSPGLGAQGGGRSSTEDAAGTSVATGTLGGEDDDDGRSILQNGPARNGARQNPAATKRQRMSGPGSAGQPPQLPPQQRHGTASAYGSGRGGGGGSSGALRGYDDFDDLADPAPVASAPPPRETSAGRPTSQHHAGRAAAAKAAVAPKPKKVAAAPGGPRGLPSHTQLASSMASGSQASQPPRPPPAPPVPSKSKAALGSAVAADGGAAVSPSTLRRTTEVPPAKPAPVVNGTAAIARPLTQSGSEDGGVGGGYGDVGGVGAGSGSTGGGSESRMDTDGRGTTVAATATAVTASPDYESAMDMEIQAYADLDLDLQEDDKDAEWYRAYVDWNPEPHAAVQSAEQYAQYEREYRHKFDVYSRLNQKYNEVVHEADAHRAAVEAARGPDEQNRCIRALWRLGATKWKLLEVWKQARRNLHADLGDLRDKVAEYVARQAGAVAAAVVQPPPPQMQMQPS
ncbi:hypothetical protein Vretimale_13503 [Volvox reticuliferus]|uniref:OCEL domain-containing protein n=1 Tax=Volvox reticuliferus TaxID=1737510 RepID=A0A8J4GLK8_9CHLO|nr:hypothetical protein Vretifemale_359 [Volvox reticuliferus]GIM09699.1 hypothetical protein Vretimale_13503 [Volvox reticuliferus]